MSAAAGVRLALVVFVAAVLQVSVFSTIVIGGAAPNVLLVVLVAIALGRGAVAGAVSGFVAGLLVDVATLGTLGLSSLILTLVGHWVGRYGETTGRNRPHAPLAGAVAAAVFAGIGGYLLDALLGGPVAIGPVLLSLPAAVLWSALLAYPVVALVRKTVGGADRVERAREVELVV